MCIRDSVPLSVVEEEPEVSPAERKELNIFMVEDIELNITVARSLLESMGHEVSVAMTGQDAIEMFDPEIYDLAFLDIQLPDMAGFDVAEFYRKTYKDLPPLVALTANVLKNKNEYLEKGMDDAISKPLSVTAVQEVIAKFTSDEDYQQPEPVTVVESPEGNDLFSRVLDLDMLESYVGIVGSQPVLDLSLIHI